MKIRQLDHLVLTVTDPDRTIDFYTRILGMTAIPFGDGRLALHFGHQKINLHVVGEEIEPHASVPTPGSADLCFLVEGSLDAILDHLHTENVPVILGPVDRTGAHGPQCSIYLRDPDGNLIELATPSPPP